MKRIYLNQAIYRYTRHCIVIIRSMQDYNIIPYLQHRLLSAWVLMDNFYRFLVLLHIHHKNNYHYSHLRKNNLRFLEIVKNILQLLALPFGFVNTSKCNPVTCSNELISFLDNSTKGEFLQQSAHILHILVEIIFSIT